MTLWLVTPADVTNRILQKMFYNTNSETNAPNDPRLILTMTRSKVHVHCIAKMLHFRVTR